MVDLSCFTYKVDMPEVFFGLLVKRKSGDRRTI